MMIMVAVMMMTVIITMTTMIKCYRARDGSNSRARGALPSTVSGRSLLTPMLNQIDVEDNILPWLPIKYA